MARSRGIHITYHVLNSEQSKAREKLDWVLVKQNTMISESRMKYVYFVQICAQPCDPRELWQISETHRTQNTDCCALRGQSAVYRRVWLSLSSSTLKPSCSVPQNVHAGVFWADVRLGHGHVRALGRHWWKSLIYRARTGLGRNQMWCQLGLRLQSPELWYGRLCYASHTDCAALFL